MPVFANTWWLKLFGFDEDRIPDGATIQFIFMHLPVSWGVFVFIGACLLLAWFTIYIYRRERSRVSGLARAIPALLRMLVFALVIFVLLGPGMTYTKTTLLRPTVTLLRDASLSMNTRDLYGEERSAQAAAATLDLDLEALREQRPPRTAITDAVLNRDDNKLLKTLAERGRLKTFDFADEPNLVSGQQANDTENDGVSALPPTVTGGAVTDLARALRDGMKDKLTSAVVLISDGQHNTGTDLEEAERDAAKRGVPVFVIGVGDPLRPQNLQVADLYVDPQVWKDDPFEIQAILLADGVGQGVVEVELVEVTGDTDDDTTEVIESRTVSLSGESQEEQVKLTFEHKESEPGTRRYSVRVTPLESEQDKSDNTPDSPAEVKILDNKARVLLISGSASWEYRNVTPLLMREKTVDLSCWLQDLESGREQQGNTRITLLPTSKEELFAYDVILLLDPDPAEFDPAWVELLQEFVRDRAGGLLFMPGAVHGAPFYTSFQARAVRNLLPVVIDEFAATAAAVGTDQFTRAWPVQVVTANADQPIMRLSSDSERSIELWEKLPPIYWSFPASSAKPSARVLLEHSDPALRTSNKARPLLVTGNFGSGRVVYLGLEGTYLWRRAGRDAEFFKRFWLQCTRYLVESQSLGGKRRGTVEAGKTRYQIGERIDLTARLKTLDFQPLAEERIEAEMTLPDGTAETMTFKPVQGDPGTYRARTPAIQAGGHTVAITLAGDADGDAVVETGFHVILPIKETRQTELARESLEQIATLTGGKYLDPDQADTLGDLVPDRVRTLEVQSPPVPLWNTWRVLVLLLALLAAEWILRKRFKMI